MGEGERGEKEREGEKERLRTREGGREAGRQRIYQHVVGTYTAKDTFVCIDL